MTKQKSKRINLTILIMALALICLAVSIWRLGLSVWSALLFSIWIIIFIFRKGIAKSSLLMWFVVSFTIVISLSISIFFQRPNSEAISYEGIKLAECTSTDTTQTTPMNGWKSTIYSAPLRESSPEPDESNGVKTFSYFKIKNQTETNSLYARVEKSDGSYITGHGVTMEVCDENNMSTKSYTTKNTNYAAGDSVTASVSYFHGGQYLHGTGKYRVDVYVREKDNKWHLIDRMTNIFITE